jgi:hypothetical protein
MNVVTGIGPWLVFLTAARSRVIALKLALGSILGSNFIIRDRLPGVHGVIG